MPALAARPRYRRSHGWTVRCYWHGQEREITKYKGQRFGHGDEGRKRAEAAARQIDGENPEQPRRRPGALPVDGLVYAWCLEQLPTLADRSQATSKAPAKRLAAHFRGREARELTEGELVRYAAGLSPYVARQDLSLLRRCLNLAVKARVLEAHPVPTISDVIARRVAQDRTEIETPDAWSRAEVAELLALAERLEPQHVYPVLRVAFATGMRRGELLALQWRDVDFDRTRIHVRRALRLGGGGRGTKPPKSGRDRLVPMAPELADFLRRHRLSGTEGLWVFPSPTGELWWERNWAARWEKVRNRAAKVKGIRPFGLHSTRKTFITMALEAGKPVLTVSRWVGASPQVLERHYAGVIDGLAEEVDFLGGEITGPPAKQERSS